MNFVHLNLQYSLNLNRVPIFLVNWKCRIHSFHSSEYILVSYLAYPHTCNHGTCILINKLHYIMHIVAMYTTIVIGVLLSQYTIINNLYKGYWMPLISLHKFFSWHWCNSQVQYCCILMTVLLDIIITYIEEALNLLIKAHCFYVIVFPPERVKITLVK